jgi:hypothetical protein
MDNSTHEIPALSSSSASKYECSYCGKGFSRPSSLKVSSCIFYVLSVPDDKCR